MTKPEAPEKSFVDVVGRPDRSHRHQGHPVPHMGHPFVPGMGGNHPTGRGTGGWIWMDDPAFEAHVCVVCGRPLIDPIHVADPHDE